MPRIEVNFRTEDRTSKAGNPYKLLSMYSTNGKTGEWSDRSDFSVTPFAARLLMEHLEDFLLSLLKAEGKLPDSVGGNTEPPPSVPYSAPDDSAYVADTSEDEVPF